MKQFFGYVRVSTAKQGQQGVSLPEQREAILRHANRVGFNISSWFEERETAAKRGRPVFNRMLKSLRKGEAAGVILHKIDRGARNLKDWADLADLIDAGIQVHFANESLDMQSRGGRLSADIQAVVAADYIRNLREETKKGFYGRLKQGIYPLPAPLGYLDKGKGNPKVPDPLTAPLVKKAFELYATGRYALPALRSKLDQLGLRNKRGGPVSINGLSRMLRNPFYIGLIRLTKTGEMFSGIHKPIISKSQFNQVRLICSGRINTRVHKHDFLFRKMLHCQVCGHTMNGEHQKRYTYYRCHTANCPVGCVREEIVEAEVNKQLKLLRFNDDEKNYVRSKLATLKTTWGNQAEEESAALKLQMTRLDHRMNRLTDAFLDGNVDQEVYEHRKTALLMEKKDIEENMANLRELHGSIPERLSEFLELADRAWLSYEMGLLEQKRDLLRIVTSNFVVNEKNVAIKLSFPFSEIAKRSLIPPGDPYREILRTWERLLSDLTAACKRGVLPCSKRSNIDCDSYGDDDISNCNQRKRGFFVEYGNT